MKNVKNEYEETENSKNYVVLSHTDYLIDVAERRSRGETRVLERYHLPTLRKGGVDIICDHVGGDTQMFSTFPLTKMLTASDSLERSLYGIDCMWEESNESNNISIIKEKSDISGLKESGNLGIILCLQGGSPIKEDIALLRIFHRLGIRCIHLTANKRNQISDSCIDRDAGGLTDFGIEVVREMNRIGMVIDISQLSHKGCLDVLNVSDSPVIASNSNARAICDHPRNLYDDVIDMVGSNGGVIGIHCLPSFLSSSGDASIDDIVKHISYIANRIGIGHVGIGPDLLENWPSEKHDAIWGKTQSLQNQKIAFDYPRGFESIGDIPKLKDRLISHGYSQDEVNLVMGDNFIRVFNLVWI